jgi:glycosyltransferase involved in cell wall biosynthesis
MILLGHQENPYKYMKAADLFVLQSYYEGRPMVVDEAMILGTPVLVSDYGSAHEQIPIGCGVVVANEESKIYNEIKSLLDNREKLSNYRQNLKLIDASEYKGTKRYVQLLKGVMGE